MANRNTSNGNTLLRSPDDPLQYGSQPLGQARRSLTADKGSGTGLASAQDLSVNLSNSLNNQTAMNSGMLTLQDILASQGKVDPRARNRALVNVGRNTEAQQLQQSQGAAQRGLQNSGAMSAINAAIGASGADRAAAVDVEFTQQEEQRKRDDLLLMLQMLINPSLQQIGTAAGVGQGNADRSQANRGALISGLTSFGSSATGGFG